MSRCELTVKDDFRLTEKTMRTSHFKANAIMKAAVLAASILLFGVSASFGQQTVNLTAAPTTTTLPDGTTVPSGKVVDRKSTRLNSSHVAISYAVFCLKKKKNQLSLRERLPKLETRLSVD